MRAGDYEVSIVPALATSDTHDVGAGQEALREARLNGLVDATTCAHPVPEGGTSEGERRATADVDASIARARSDADEIPVGEELARAKARARVAAWERNGGDIGAALKEVP